MRPLLVSEVNNYIKKLFSSDMLLTFVKIEGEISNFTHHYSGHMYFSLKDDKSRIRCVMFKTDNGDMDFKPKDGMKVVVSGAVSVYEKDGSYQVYVKKMEEQGLGDLHREFNLMKEKLEKDGLFDHQYKKKLPRFPRTIGVVTSSTGAAIRDILTILKRRYPPVNIVVYPALVQGDGAPASIIRGLEGLDKREDIDLIITGRGGGSMEELFAFNDEKLARCIFGLHTPVISAVGHETDFTIADFVADVRASTPSAAAELAVPDGRNLLQELGATGINLRRAVTSRLQERRIDLDTYSKSLFYLNPVRSLLDRKMELDNILRSVERSLEKTFHREEKRLSELGTRIRLADPHEMLSRGYGIVTDENGNVKKSVSDIKPDQMIFVRMIDGRAKTKVVHIEEGNHGE